MRKVSAALAIGLALLLAGCMSLLDPGGGIFNGDEPNGTVVVKTFVPHAAPPLRDPYPLFVGGRWVYRNATVDYNPEVHPVSLLVSEVLANVYCVDEATQTAWECFAVQATEHPNQGSVVYLHRDRDGLMQFDETLQDPERDFPGFIYFKYPFIRNTYWVYNVPRTGESTEYPLLAGEAMWERAWGCRGDRNLFNIGGEGECEVGSKVVFLNVLYSQETVGISKVVNSLLEGYTSLFTQAWKAELYEGIDEYPNYQWWTHEPEYAWLAPDVGIVKWVRGSNALELTQFVRPDEVLALSGNPSGNLERVPKDGLAMVQLRGTKPTSPDSMRWELTENSGLTPENVAAAVLEPVGDREFYTDIDSTGSPLLSGTYVFRFRASDLGYATLRFEREGDVADSSPSEVSYRIKVGDFNSTPIAANDSFDLLEDSEEEALDVLENDYDIDPGDRVLLAEIEEPPSHGSAAIDGKHVLYTPEADFVGTDSFEYRVRDLFGATADARVTVDVVDVNDPPSAVDDAFEVPEDSIGNILLVLANDTTEPDVGEVLQIESVAVPQHGSVSISADGVGLEYSPEEDFVGEDVFTYTVGDSRGGTSEATVTVQVNNVNDPPTAIPDSYSVARGSADNVLDVLGNDSDIDVRDRLRISRIVAAPSSGTASTDGMVIRYTPNEGFSGVDELRYQIVDMAGLRATASVTIEVE